MADWRQLRDDFGPAVWSTVYRILAHDADANDCLQEVFVEAFEQAGRTPVNNWCGYLRWLAVRRALDVLRRRRRQVLEPLTTEIAQRSAASPSERLELSELVARVRRELGALPESQATAFWLACVEGLSHGEIAEQMTITENAVAMLVHRARQHLKIQLADVSPIRMAKE